MGGVTIGLGNGALHVDCPDHHVDNEIYQVAAEASLGSICDTTCDPMAFVDKTELLSKDLQAAQHALRAAEEEARSSTRALQESRAELQRCEQLLRGRAQEVEHAAQAKSAAESHAIEAGQRAAALYEHLQQERREKKRLSEQLSEARSEQSKASENESLRLREELQAERSNRRQLEAGSKAIATKAEELQKRCSTLEHAKKEVSELRSKLDMAIKAKANALAMAGKAVAETESLRAMMKKSAEQRRAAAKHARSMEVELDAERAELQRKAEEMGRQQVALQDNLTAVQAAGVLSKSGTMRFEINGMSSPTSKTSRPSTAASPAQPDDIFRLTNQVRELQDRLRWYQEQQQGGQPRHGPQSPSGQHDRDARNEDLMQMATAIGAGQAMMNQVHANDEAGAVDLRLQLQHERAAAAQKEANLQAELEFIKNERSHAHKRADLHSRQMHELQIQLRAFQQAQEFPFLQETRHEMDGLKGELTEAKQALAKSQEWASDAKATISEKDALIASLQHQASATKQVSSRECASAAESRPMYIRRGRRDPGTVHTDSHYTAVRPTTAPAMNSDQVGAGGNRPSSVTSSGHRRYQTPPPPESYERQLNSARPPTSPAGATRSKVVAAWSGIGADSPQPTNTASMHHQSLRHATTASAGAARSSGKSAQLWRSRSGSMQRKHM